jgi:transposase
MVMKSGGQFDVFTRGRIIGMAESGKKPADIAARVRKTNNKRPKPDAVRKTIFKSLSMKGWKGERKVGSGRPHLLSVVVKKQIASIVFKHRGKNVVTILFIKKLVPQARKVSNQTVTRALHEAGLAWLRRRAKRFIPEKYIAPRQSISRWLIRQPQEQTTKYAFVDGTAYYLALSDTQDQDKRRARLGKFVWRDAEGKDGLFTENIGASLYAAKQGAPVKVWGLLCNGHLCIHILPTDETTKSGTAHMNGCRYQAMINRYGKKWVRECHGGRLPHSVTLIQDHERCLWTDGSLACLASSHLKPLEGYPACSPDLNVIENVWAHLREKLNMDSPARIETREAFLVRLRGAVRSLNTTGRDTLLTLCHSMKDRARGVLANKGGPSGW